MSRRGTQYPAPTRGWAAAAETEVAEGRRLVFKHEGIGLNRLQDMKVTNDFTFGIELELFFPASVDANRVRNDLRAAGVTDWRLKHDSSIVCNPDVPACYRAELVSPVLRGTTGLQSIYTVLEAIKHCKPAVNKSTGLHVHLKPVSDRLSTSGWQLPLLKTFSYNFVQLESGFDLLMPHSRRANNNDYCASNVLTALAAGRSKRDALSAMRGADRIETLKALVCPNGRYYKLNLWALDRHGTIEIRHPAGTQNASKVVGYVVMYLALAEASLAGKLAAMPLKGYVFQNLIDFLSFNHVLLHWMTRRQQELNPKRQRGGGASTSAAGGCGPGCGCDDCRG